MLDQLLWRRSAISEIISVSKLNLVPQFIFPQRTCSMLPPSRFNMSDGINVIHDRFAIISSTQNNKCPCQNAWGSKGEAQPQYTNSTCYVPQALAIPHSCSVTTLADCCSANRGSYNTPRKHPAAILGADIAAIAQKMLCSTTKSVPQR